MASDARAQRRRSARTGAKKPPAAAKSRGKPAAEVPAQTPQAKVEGEAAEGVFLNRIIGEDGSVKVFPAPVGDVRATEVSTIIELGLSGWREQIGLSRKES